MKQRVIRISIVLVVGLVCLGGLLVGFAGDSWAAPADDFTSRLNRSTSQDRSANVELVGHFIGEDNLGQIVIQGNYAYVKDYFYSPTCFHILDISNPANPIKVGAYTMEHCYALDVYGSYVYVEFVNSNTSALEIHIIDVADPANPVEAGIFVGHVMDRPGPLAVAYPYVYFGTSYSDPHGSSTDLHILNVSDPTNPQEVNHLGLGPVTNIVFHSNYAYITVWEGGPFWPCESLKGLFIYEITDPANPSLLFDGAVSNAGDVAITGSYAYIAGRSCTDNIDSALFVENITDPSLPTRANVLTDYYGGIEASSDYLYIGRGADLLVLDLVNPSTPKEIGFYKMPLGMSDFKVSRGYIYVTAGTDGLYILRLTRTITGQVTDANAMSYPGVKIEASHGLSTTVGADGYYTFTNPVTGTYTVTPTLLGYTFLPASRSLTVPSYEALAADFTILPKPVGITLTPGLTTTLTLTDTQGLTTTLFFPAGAVTETVSLTLTPTLGTSQLSWIFAGHAFDLAASHEGVLLPDLTFSVPVTVTIYYSNVDTRLVDESRLALWEWVGSTWQDAAQVCEPPAGYRHDEAGNMVSLAICRVGTFKLMGPTYPVFLPVITLTP